MNDDREAASVAVTADGKCHALDKQPASVLRWDSFQIAEVPGEEQLTGHLKAPSGKGTGNALMHLPSKVGICGNHFNGGKCSGVLFTVSRT